LTTRTKTKIKTKRKEPTFTKRSKLIAESITKYNHTLEQYRKYTRTGHEHYVPALYHVLRKYMSVSSARNRLHTDIVDSGIIGERNFMLYLPDEAKDMTHSHKGKGKKQVQQLANGQTMEVPEIESEPDPGDQDEDDAEEPDVDESEVDDEEDDDIPVTTEKEFLESLRGANSLDTSFGVGVRTVNFEIPEFDQDKNKMAQSLYHECFHSTLVYVVKSRLFTDELMKELFRKLKLDPSKAKDLEAYTDMAVSIGKSVISWDKIKKR
jgi:hypothetical protein